MLFVPVDAVVAVGVPVKVGETRGAAPKFVNAAAEVVAPVPPFAIAIVFVQEATPEPFVVNI